MENRNNKTNNKTSKKRIWPWIAVIAVVVVAAAVGLIAAKVTTNKGKSNIPQSQTGAEADQSEWGNRLTYKGKNYRKNENISTVLFVGVDQNSEDQWDDYGEATEGVIGNSGRADSIILFVLNDETQTTKMLLISRDTMTEVDVYDKSGKFAYSTQNHLNMQYSYGDSPSKSLYLMKRTVGDLLYKIRIDGALSLTMDGISKIVDLLGGIPLTMAEDYSYIDERYTEGTTVTLDGKEMEHFIRYRDTNEFASNEKRVARQSWLIGEVFQYLKKTGAMSFIEDIIDKDPDYIEADVDGELLKKLSKYQIESEKLRLPGENVQGEKYDEFHVDEEALQDLIVELLYVPAE